MENCCVCEKKFEHWYSKETLQPSDGAELNFKPSYGSKHDLIGSFYRGVICDDCSDKIIGNMQRGNYVNNKWVGDKCDPCEVWSGGCSMGTKGCQLTHMEEVEYWKEYRQNKPFTEAEQMLYNLCTTPELMADDLHDWWEENKNRGEK